MLRTLRWMKLLGFTVILAIALSFAITVGYAIFVLRDTDLFLDHAMAFTAGFIGFAFSWLGIWVSKVTDRLTKHRNAVVHFEHLLNRNINLVSHVKRQLLRAIEVTESYHFYVFAAISLETDYDRPSELLDIELMNDLLDVNSHLNSLNKDYSTLTTWYGSLVKAFQDGKIPDRIYRANVDRVREELNTLVTFCDLVEDKLTDRMAKCKYRMEQSNVIYIEIFKALPFLQKYDAGQLQEIRGELEQELEESRETSRLELDRYGIPPGDAPDEDV